MKIVTKLSISTFLILILLTAESVFANGTLFSRPRWSSQEYNKMWIKSINVDVQIDEQIAVTHVDQRFFNELNSSVEAIYIFPLPENAVITEMIYWVNGQRFVGQIRERQDAVNDYNNHLRQWLDPALLEYLGDNLFRLSIVPIDPLSEVRCEITYVEPLAYDMGSVNYGYQLNTLDLSSQALQTVSVNVHAVSSTEFKSFTSPSHKNSTAAQITKISSNEYTFFYGDENFYPDKDLLIEFEMDRQDVDFQVLTYTPTVADSFGNDSFYALWITPPDHIDDAQILPKKIVFTADVSSSMEGERLDQLKEALDNFLNLLNPQDAFNIVTFGTFVEKFKPDLVAASSQNISAAHEYVRQLYALGLTNIDQALSQSLGHSFGESTSNNIIFLTDGEPTWGETDIEKILQNVTAVNQQHTRIFSFGIGDAINRTLVSRLSAENHGYAQFISSDDSIALVINNHFQRISNPIMRDISISMPGLLTLDRYPKVLGDLFWGSQVMQLGLYQNSKEVEIALKGFYTTDSTVFRKTVFFSDTAGGHRFVPRLWAKAKIDNLLDQIHTYGENDELVNQVIDLSLRFQILTEYTAFYADPDDPTTVIDKKINNPEIFALHQNYPNPFNPVTTISYQLPAGQALYHVTIKIYDALGRLIRVLVDENKAAGIYNVQWNGTAADGSKVPSGVYIYTIEAGSFKQSRKMLLLK